MTLHLVALPHTRVTPEFVGCAYTAKALKFCRMMVGHEDVVLYAPEGSLELDGMETVEVVSDAWRVETFGDDDPARLPAWPSLEQTAHFNEQTAAELKLRYATGDLILLTGGATHAPIREQLPDALFCEPGVGYEGLATEFAAFESYAWRHYVYGRRGVDGRWFDTVIPNYFDPDEFHLEEKTEPYLLFLGRLVTRKGPQVALEIAKACDLPLVVAGAGGEEIREGLVVAGMGTPDEVVLDGDVRYAGPVGVDDRAAILAGATAIIVPTLYVEPFGGVAVEAMLSGTPAVTSDWGAFAETVEEGVTGFRFGTLREAVSGVQLAAQLVPAEVRARALERYSLAAVRPLFLDWFSRLATLRRQGWYEMSGP